MIARRTLAHWPWLALIGLAAVPFIPGKDAAIYGEQITPILIYAILALGLNVVVGQVGLLHLGIAAFFGIGAYAAGILSVRLFPFQQSFLVIAVVAMLASAGTRAPCTTSAPPTSPTSSTRSIAMCWCAATTWPRARRSFNW